MRSRAGFDGVAAALPLAAALTWVSGRSVPLRFEYRPNDLGIVSASTQLAYPLQQETFFLVFGIVVGALLTWALGRLLAARGGSSLAVEATGAAALLGVLWLPLGFGWLAATLGTAVALWASPGRRAASALDAWREPSQAAAGPASRLRGIAVVAGVLALAPLLTPGLWSHLWSVANDVPDELLVYDQYRFLAETGQHLAWANSLARGGLHGRDFFCLYGPLYDLGLVGMWAWLGRSIAAWNLYFSLTRALAWVGLLLLAGSLVRRRPLLLLPIFLLPWVNLRAGLALFGLLFLVRSLRDWRWGLAAGATGGISLLFSQEYGLAFLVAAAVTLAVRADARAALAFVGTLGAATAPLLGYYAAHDALGPMLGDLAGYPRYMLAGFGKLPFPAVEGSLMADAWTAGRETSLVLRLGYAVPAVCLGGLLLALPISALDPRRPWSSLRALRDALRGDPSRLAIVAVAVFGLVSFRSVLGRTDINHVLAVLQPAALLLCIAVDRLLDAWRAGAAGSLTAWRAVALALFVAHAGFVQTASPVALVTRSLGNIAELLRSVPLPSGSPQVMRVTRWIRSHTEPGEPVLFLPNDAAYYYLTDRPNPIRFVLGHQMVTSAHRAEALAALRRIPPRYVVWNHGAYRVDGLPDELVLGRELLDWIQAHYRTETRFGEVEILARREAATP